MPKATIEFAVGQVWSYQSRAVEPDSTLTIVQIDAVEDAETIHISLAGLKMINPHVASGFGTAIAHLPITVPALQASVTELLATTDQLPDFQAGYDIWHQAFTAGEGGVFTLTVAECVAFLEQALNP
ncbi:MAG: hypothetical protein HC838_17265 [Spirulinaceae cyanobacterium RM2_2_10]|nr:hypothetical protein [Spirulinaceae cyanobacterium SM2_1_0]NJO21434.1 hypothetical protein [Spirulinaceae cyanobacterium RM2_2_10]